MKNLYPVILGITLVLTSCSSVEKNTVIHFTRDDFKHRAVLSNPEEIIWGNPSEVSNPDFVTLFHDSILLVQNRVRMPFAIELYSLHSGNLLAQLAPIGRGSGEFLDCAYMGHSMDQSKIYLKDRRTHTYYTVDFLKTLEDGKIYIEHKFHYDPENYLGDDLLILDDRYYAQYSMWYIDWKQHNNNVPKLKKYEMTPSDQPTYPDDPLMGYKYWVRQVNGARILLDTNKGDIWLFDGRQDRIEIYNDVLELKKTFSGPNNFKLRYEMMRTMEGVRGILFAEGKNYRTYESYAYNAKHIYVVYVGVDSFDYDAYPPVEIFKLDWEGNLLCNYKLDRYISEISIDSKEEYIYGNARTSLGDSLRFVRYKL